MAYKVTSLLFKENIYNLVAVNSRGGFKIVFCILSGLFKLMGFRAEEVNRFEIFILFPSLYSRMEMKNMAV